MAPQTGAQVYLVDSTVTAPLSLPLSLSPLGRAATESPKRLIFSRCAPQPPPHPPCLALAVLWLGPVLSAGVAVFGGSDGGGGLRGVGTRGQSVVARQPSGHQPFQWTGDPAGGQSHHPWGVPASMRNRGSRSKVMIALALQLVVGGRVFHLGRLPH